MHKLSSTSVLQEKEIVSSIQPKEFVPSTQTIFCLDNIDWFVDITTDNRSIHNTPGKAFQDETSRTVRQKYSSLNRSKRILLSPTICNSAQDYLKGELTLPVETVTKNV